MGDVTPFPKTDPGNMRESSRPGGPERIRHEEATALYKKNATASSALVKHVCAAIIEPLAPAEWQRGAEILVQNCQFEKPARIDSVWPNPIERSDRLQAARR